MENSDEEALSWAGDDARQRGGGTWSVPKRREGASLSASPDKVIEPNKVIEPVEITGEMVSTSSTNPVALVATGVFAGIYLLFAIAWLITALRDPVRFADPLAEAMFIGGLWAAVLASPAVFIGVLSFTGSRPKAIRFLLLLVGALVLVPWPYFTWAG